MKPFLPVVLGLAFLATGARGLAQAVLYYDRTAFLSDTRIIGTANVTFDGYAPGTDLTNQSASGVTFEPNGVSPLLVITGSSGVRFPMAASSGLNVLSPGGNNPGLEDDGLSVTFATPVKAAGLDVVFDVPDGASYVGVSFYDAGGALLGQNTFIPAPNGAPGYQFVGLVLDSPLIKRMVFIEFDGSASDDHVAYDSLVFSAVAIPEPGVAALIAAGLGLLAWQGRRRARSRPGRG